MNNPPQIPIILRGCAIRHYAKHEVFLKMSKKILVIDDDHLVRGTVERVLGREGYESVLATDAQDAIGKIRAEDFDLVISDIRMPGMNGVDAVKEIRRLVSETSGKKDLPIIFITGYADLSVELDAEKLGEVILKPFDLARLVMTIREYL